MSRQITIIMPVFQAALYLPQTLQSLRDQTYTEWSLLAIDDGSTDQSVQILETVPDPRVNVLRNQGRRGPAAARNRGLDRLRTPYVAFLDADDLWKPERLACQMEFLRRHPHFEIAGSRVEIIAANGFAKGPTWGFEGSAEELAPAMLFENCLATSSLLAASSVFERRRFDEQFEVASDYEMWARLLPASPACVLPERLVRYRVHPANISHRKAAKLEDALREIARRQLRRLEVDPMPVELEIHRRIARRQYAADREFVRAAENWLRKLRDANRNRRLYPVLAFERVLAQRWFEVCRAATGLGPWLAGAFYRSGLARPWSVPPLSAARFHASLIKHSLLRVWRFNQAR